MVHVVEIPAFNGANGVQVRILPNWTRPGHRMTDDQLQARFEEIKRNFPDLARLDVSYTRERDREGNFMRYVYAPRLGLVRYPRCDFM
jgi:hypothetical protein